MGLPNLGLLHQPGGPSRAGGQSGCGPPWEFLYSQGLAKPPWKVNCFFQEITRVLRSGCQGCSHHCRHLLPSALTRTLQGREQCLSLRASAQPHTKPTFLGEPESLRYEAAMVPPLLALDTVLIQRPLPWVPQDTSGKLFTFPAGKLQPTSPGPSFKRPGCHHCFRSSRHLPACETIGPLACLLVSLPIHPSCSQSTRAQTLSPVQQVLNKCPEHPGGGRGQGDLGSNSSSRIPG